MATVLNKIGTALSNVWKALFGEGSNTHRDSALERHLSQAMDVHDLEARERAWNQRMQGRNYY